MMKGHMKNIRSFLLAIALFVAIPFHISAQGSVLLVGGGSEDYNDWSNVPYKWLVDHAPNKRILVMHYSTGSVWLEGYFTSLGAVSAKSLIVNSTAVANDSATYRAILEADGIFLRGGDQYQYILKWKGTLTEQAIREVYQRGGVVGGTSAGEAVLSQVIFDAKLASVEPRNALRTPLNAGISFTENFLGFAPGLLADSHFYERGRIGRLIAMMALYRSQTGKEITGAGVDYNTALAITPDGTAEVMGAGTVTLLRFQSSTTATLAAGEPLSVRNLRLDQLTVGSKVDLKNGTITLPPIAFPYTPAVLVSTKGRIQLDGGTRSDWFAASGSLRALSTAIASSTDTVAIIASVAGAATAASVDSFLSLLNTPSRTIFVHAASSNSPVTAGATARCKSYILCGLTADSIGALLSDSTLMGTTLRLRLDEGATLLFLGDDALVAGNGGVSRVDYHAYGAYYGYMTRVRGTAIAGGIMTVPRLYESSDLVDNRASALFWGMAGVPVPIGLLLDNGTTASVSEQTLTVTGKTPAIVIDARTVTMSGLPTWKDPGKANPRQNGALIGALIHVVRNGESLDLAATTPQSVRTMERPGPEGFALGQNYPNPFNGTTQIPFTLSIPCSVTMELYDVSGRRIAKLIDRTYPSGAFTIPVDLGAMGLASANLVYRIEVRNANGIYRDAKMMTMIK